MSWWEFRGFWGDFAKVSFCMAAISASWAAARGLPMITGLGFRLLLRPSEKWVWGFCVSGCLKPRARQGVTFYVMRAYACRTNAWEYLSRSGIDAQLASIGQFENVGHECPTYD